MTYNLQSGKTFEETVESLFNQMGYHTKLKNVLHTRASYIHAVMQHPKGTQRLFIECKNSVDIIDVQHFCSKVAFARENLEVDGGLLIANVGFSDDAVSWCKKNCSFVELKTYKQLIAKSASFRKMLKKFSQ
ncbi:MAG: restriction endonuclease [Nitrososphaerota archaeon]|jgi:hypothetical protein|uniref:restriction endonuclease n=1 Tax=Candidatus Bathycorpusculum sp. TaxID=2994959 RepID=UPI0028336FA9|nr:restriction endonuclease [Candidatus Termitimicrobium sp.]MCL2432306.1 restriction endonuclease [Candidatus Termitimicrobium sp.]MDR0492533.1 restriction endonuclease [Nitrososphaerota archaeon]